MATHTVLARAQSVAPGLYVASQLLPHEVAQAKAAGFRTIINNRPDFEGGPDQPTSAQVEAAARAEGLVYHHLPVPPSGYGDSDARRMYELVQASPQPVLAFCRTGRRSAALYEKGSTLP